MAGLEVWRTGNELHPGHRAPSVIASGPIRSALFRPDGSSLWELDAEMGAGAEVRWGSDHGDEVVYVLDGELELDGVRCGPRSAAIVESGVEARARVTTHARVLHFGSRSPDATDDPSMDASTDRRRVHLVGAEDAVLVESADGERGSLHYADSTCPTCRVAFFENFFHGPSVVRSHAHTQDEIMRVTSGEIQMGPVTLRAGTSVAIPGGHRYGFRSAGSISFLNYRRDLSMYVGAPGSAPIPETLESVRAVRTGPPPN